MKSAAGLLDVLLESLADALSTAASATPSVHDQTGRVAILVVQAGQRRARPVLLVEDDPTEARRSEGSSEPAGRPMDR